ncbi:MAG TPA: YceD family protein, partial [Nitrospirota bacterium]|nr:YceD family protein [Nitrospirota bacterium]
MVIRISDIPPEGLTLELAHDLDLFDQGTATTAFQAVIGIRPASRGILRVTGKIHSSPVLECSRCLEKFTFAIDTELDIELAPVSALGAAAEHELAGGELDTEFYEGDVIEPVDLIKEQLLISIPMVPLHSPEC